MEVGQVDSSIQSWASDNGDQGVRDRVRISQTAEIVEPGGPVSKMLENQAITHIQEGETHRPDDGIVADTIMVPDEKFVNVGDTMKGTSTTQETERQREVSVMFRRVLSYPDGKDRLKDAIVKNRLSISHQVERQYDLPVDHDAISESGGQAVDAVDDGDHTAALARPGIAAALMSNDNTIAPTINRELQTVMTANGSAQTDPRLEASRQIRQTVTHSTQSHDQQSKQRSPKSISKRNVTSRLYKECQTQTDGRMSDRAKVTSTTPMPLVQNPPPLSRSLDLPLFPIVTSDTSAQQVNNGNLSVGKADRSSCAATASLDEGRLGGISVEDVYRALEQFMTSKSAAVTSRLQVITQARTTKEGQKSVTGAIPSANLVSTIEEDVVPDERSSPPPSALYEQGFPNASRGAGGNKRPPSHENQLVEPIEKKRKVAKGSKEKGQSRGHEDEGAIMQVSQPVLC